jgi:hypothetical protein
VAAPAGPVGAGAAALLVPAFDPAVPPPPVVPGARPAVEGGLLPAWPRLASRRTLDCSPPARLADAGATSDSPILGERTVGIASPWSAAGSVSWGSGANPIRPAASAASHAASSTPTVVAANRTACFRPRPEATKIGRPSVEEVGSNIYRPNPSDGACIPCVLMAGRSMCSSDAASRNPQHRANFQRWESQPTAGRIPAAPGGRVDRDGARMEVP